MNENLKAFLQKASEDGTLQTKLAEINDSVMSDARAKFIKLAEENGFKFTEEDMDHVTAESEKLSEDELNAVAGGAYSCVVGDKRSKYYNKKTSDCMCAFGGGGTADEYQKTCACVLGGCGELTKLGKEKADNNEITWLGKKSSKVAMCCALMGSSLSSISEW